jgi:hypothetical protein
VATDAPKIIRLQATVVMAWKRSSVRSRSGPPINQQLTNTRFLVAIASKLLDALSDPDVEVRPLFPLFRPPAEIFFAAILFFEFDNA